MLVKVLGAIDLIISLIIFSHSWGLTLPGEVLIVMAVILFIKGIFIFTGDIASGMDWIVGIVLIIESFFVLPVFVLIIAGFLLLQKGFLSVVA